MDYTISNNAKLLDALLEVLQKHKADPGVPAVIEDLQAAKANYIQRSMDHMLKCLILTLYDLVSQPRNEDLQKELGAVIREYATWSFQAGERISALSHEYDAHGGKLLSRDEILQEVSERRGTSR